MRSLVIALSLLTAPAWAQEGAEPAPEEKPPFDWVDGPGAGPLGAFAEIAVPEGYRFTDSKGTRMLMEVMGNPVSGDELGFLAPGAEGQEWFVVFEFDDIGYVKDDDKDDLDPGAILDSIKQGNEAANEMRRERGWPTLEIVGWETPPKYNTATNNLEWAVRAKSQDGPNGEPGGFVVNHNTRVLGRKGVMRVSLVVDPEEMQTVLPTYETLMKGFAYKEGEKYAEFSSGDKIAEYGLVALVAGGAGAVAAKTGLLAKFGKGIWKLLVFVVVGIGAAAKKLFGGKSQA